MCLAIPGKIKTINKTTARVDFSGVTRDVSLDFVPGAKTGSYVLVHAGFAIQVLDEKDALETSRLSFILFSVFKIKPFFDRITRYDRNPANGHS